MRTNFVFRYFVDHFRGRLSLGLSFWVNFVAPGALLYFTATQFREMAAADERFMCAYLAFLACNAVVYGWQVCGAWRAAERALVDSPWQPWGRGVQAIVLLTSLVFLGQLLGSVQMSSQRSPQQTDRDSRPGYVLDLSPDGTVVKMSGDIDFGITRDLTQLLENHESIRIIGLESHGGLVSEARGLAMLITRYGLTTYASGVCSSACTHAYVSGKRRILGSGARLGFHRYRQDSPHVSLFMDPVAEQRKDLDLFRRQNVASNFIQRVLDTPNSDMWFPSHEELLDAGVVHEVESHSRTRR